MDNNIFVISDLHLDHLYSYDKELLEYLLEKMYNRQEKYIIIAGDIATMDSDNLFAFLTKIDYFSTLYKKTTYYVLGNHDYYYNNGIDVADFLSANENMYGSLIFLGDHLEKNKENFIDHEVHIIGGESWFDTSRDMDLFWMMSDSVIIQDAREMITKKYNNFNNHTDNITDSSIVVTHHAPTNRSISQKFMNSGLNHYYVSDLDKIIETKSPKIWIHGHMHEYKRFYINDTQIICNPLGYPSELKGNTNMRAHIDMVCKRGCII